MCLDNFRRKDRWFLRGDLPLIVQRVNGNALRYPVTADIACCSDESTPVLTDIRNTCILTQAVPTGSSGRINERFYSTRGACPFSLADDARSGFYTYWAMIMDLNKHPGLRVILSLAFKMYYPYDIDLPPSTQLFGSPCEFLALVRSNEVPLVTEPIHFQIT